MYSPSPALPSSRALLTAIASCSNSGSRIANRGINGDRKLGLDAAPVRVTQPQVIPAPESALRSLPGVAVPSAQVFAILNPTSGVDGDLYTSIDTTTDFTAR